MATEGCVMCAKDTGVEINTHIDFRQNYVEGMGQLCKECYEHPMTENYQGFKQFSKGEDVNRIIIDAKLISDTPNDSELGAKLRKMFLNS